MCVASRPPNKPTNGGTAKPDQGRLAWDHMRPWCHVLWVLLTYPWSERVKPLRVERCWIILVVVFCVLCCGHKQPFSYSTNNTYFVGS